MNKYFLKQKFFILFFLTFSIIFFSFPFFTLAQPGGDLYPVIDNSAYVDELTGGTIILEEGGVVEIIFRLIRWFLTFLGVIAVLVIIFGGFTWMTAAGNDEKVGKAKKVIIQGVIGLIIVMFAFAIATFVINQIHQLAVTSSQEESLEPSP